MLNALWENVSPRLASRQQVAETLVAILPRYVDVAALQLYLLDEGDGSLVCASSWVAKDLVDAMDVDDDTNVSGPREAPPASIAPGQGVCWQAVQTGRLYNVPNLRLEPLCTDADRERGGSRLVVPLPASRAHADEEPEKETSSERRVLGVLSLEQNREAAFSTADEERMKTKDSILELASTIVLIQTGIYVMSLIVIIGAVICRAFAATFGPQAGQAET